MSTPSSGTYDNSQVSTVYGIQQVNGAVMTVGSETPNVVGLNAANYITECNGTVVPTDGTANYAKGAVFVKTDAGSDVDGRYYNIGTKGSCKFVTAASITPDEIALANTHILVGGVDALAHDVALSGAVAITNAGVSSLNSNAVVTATITDANVTLAKLASGIAPSHVVKFAGAHTTTGGGGALETFSVPGSLTNDVLTVTVTVQGASTPVLLAASVSMAGIVQIIFDVDPGADTVIAYQILRAAS